MKVDSVGQFVYSESDLIQALKRNPDLDLGPVLVDFNYNDTLDLGLEFQTALDTLLPVEDWDHEAQQHWLMPEQYRALDIAQYVLDLCGCDAERQRAGQELLMYFDRDLFPLLCYLKYLVDVMRDNNIVYGVGRGSSVASFVLYLMGVHRVNSLEYDLDIAEFLR
jgi:hypothetical protein